MYIVVQCGLSSIVEDGTTTFDSERDLEVVFRNKYSGQVMSKNKIIIL
jgi:hypothetical protein